MCRPSPRHSLDQSKRSGASRNAKRSRWRATTSFILSSVSLLRLHCDNQGVIAGGHGRHCLRKADNAGIALQPDVELVGSNACRAA